MITRWLFSDPLPVGAEAPLFTAEDQDAQPFSLSSYRGRNVVLVFYPGDDTPTCRKQLCEFRDEWEQARVRDVAVFGVNPQRRDSHQAFRRKFGLPMPLLVDEGRRIAALYHAKGLWVARTVYLIGRDGRIRFAVRGKPPVREVLAAAE